MKTTTAPTGIAAAKALAAKAGLIQATAAPTPAEEQQAKNLEAAIVGAIEEKKEKKTKKAGPSPSDIVNCFPTPGTQGRQPEKVLAKNLSPTLRKMYFSGESRKEPISEAAQAEKIATALKDGNLPEVLASIEQWKYNVLPGFVMTGEELAEKSPDHVVYLKKGRILELAKAIIEQELHDAGIFDMNEVENPLAS